ncbi:MAG TPA: type 2 lanthipeptide synthetase LanM family protein [Thermoanaerobaculia bacterium]|jgi:type 2 lantibiotic biosynthesis protein LanM
MRPLDASWYRALSLEERAALLGAAAAALPWDEAAAEQRLARWRGQPPFSDAAVFARRLATEGLDEPAFRYLLGVPPETLAEAVGSPPVWLEDVLEAQGSPVTALPGDSPPGFLDVAAPFIDAAAARMRAGAEEIRESAGGGAPFDPAQVGDIFFPLLPLRLEQLLGRSLAVELHIARLEGRLSGATPEERFLSFVRAACCPEARAEWLAANPVLARQISLAVRQWSEVSLETLGRLAADWADLRETFCAGEDPGLLTAIEGESGDRHRGGRCVIMLRFASGFRLAYKPRPMAVDVHFGELLAWLDARGSHPPFRCLRVLDRGRYGWQEHAAPAACASRQEIERFYERTGGYLALFYALEATDFHSENLIAAGEQPVPIDLESLFHGRIGGLAPTHPNSPAERALGHSVLRIGLLPEPIRDSGGFDLSALGDAGDQLTPLPLPSWEDRGTDEMRIVRRPLRIPGAHNRPTLDGAAADPLEHSAALLRGFTQVYRLLLDHRSELLETGGPLDRFAGDEMRALIRPSMVYARLLQESFHPFLLQSALERDRHFDLLWQAVPAHPFLEPAVQSEKADLLRGDIPSFTSRPGSRDLWDSRGRRLSDFFDEPPLEAVRRRLLQLSDEDLERQLWFIRVSLATLALEKGTARLPNHALAEPAERVSRDDLLAGARAIGDRLDLLAVRGESDVSWLGVRMVDEVWRLVPLGPDLYDGLLGIALFLGILGAVCGEECYTALARGALKTARHQLAAPEVPPLVGAFSGWGGMLYTLLHLGSLWDDPALLAEAEELAAGRLAELLEQDESWDVMAGSAGCLAVLLALHRTTGSEHALAGAVRCGQRLLAAARPAGDGIGWITPGAADRSLAGFSHGTAGIAWALASLAEATGDERFRDAARAALRYERSLFLPAVGNWSDLREAYRSAPDDELMIAWCHGAAGIGLARLLTRPLLDDPGIDEEIEIALGTVLREGFGMSHSLCHGDFGNLEPLLLAAQAPRGERWAAEVERLGAVLMASIRQDGWLCAIPEGVQTPGLMIGLAGIGYGLLRLAAPDRVPSVLALEPPRVGGVPRKYSAVTSTRFPEAPPAPHQPW